MAFLERNDSYALFQALGALLITGPTRTNVNDFRAVLVQP
jgi:glycerate 2-kinase